MQKTYDMRSFWVNLESTFYDPRKSVFENYVAKMARIFDLYANINGTFIQPKNYLKPKKKFSQMIFNILTLCYFLKNMSLR